LTGPVILTPELFAIFRLRPVGAAIVARTFVRMLKRDGSSYLHWPGGFVPSLPAKTPGQFGFADLVTFAGITQP